MEYSPIKNPILPKLLVVSWGVYPTPTGSTITLNGLVKAFSPQEMVLFGENLYGGDTAGWDDERPRIVYTKPSVRLYTKGSKYFRWIGIERTINEIVGLAQKESCTAILCLFPDEYYLYAAYAATKKLNIPLFTWFHNTYLDNRTGVLGVLARWLQPLVFAHASMNFTMSDGMQRFFEQKYPNVRFQVLRHCFDIPIAAKLAVLDNTIIKFAYTGSLNESCADAALRLCKYLITQPNYELHILGGKATINAFETAGIYAAPNVIFHGFVPDIDFISILQTCHIVLLPHGFEGDRAQAEFETIFPTRTVPLLYCGRPILAHSPKGVFLTDFLRQYDCGEVVTSKSRADIQAAIDRLLSDAAYCQKLVDNAKKTALLFDKNIIAQQLLNAINESI